VLVIFAPERQTAAPPSSRNDAIAYQKIFCPNASKILVEFIVVIKVLYFSLERQAPQQQHRYGDMNAYIITKRKRNLLD